MERSYISDLGRVTWNPSVAALGRIADALGIESHQLLFESLKALANRKRCSQPTSVQGMRFPTLFAG